MIPHPERTPWLDRPSIRRKALLLLWLGLSGVLLARAGQLQVVEAAHWRGVAAVQHMADGDLAAPRGQILDRSGVALATSREAYRVAVAPHELRRTPEVEALLQSALGLTPAQLQRVLDRSRRWVPLPDRYPPSAQEALRGVVGVHFERDLRRFHLQGDLAPALLGTVLDGRGAGGIEQQFDAHLEGIPGRQRIARDSRGRPLPGEPISMETPVPGGDVVLTLDRDLQEIAREALATALAETGSRGGDLLVTDPRSGEVLAMVSVNENGEQHLGGVTTPYEPGSTLKPLSVATLLRLDRVSLLDSIDTGDGRWQVAGRTVSDISKVGKVTLARAIQVSSNVAIARIADRMTPEEQFEGLRDFGFGVATGIQLPGEAQGVLRHPRNWSRQSQVSLAIGYEVSVTPLQLAMAYGALANGGLLLEPRIIREIRGPSGEVLERFEPRVVRRVLDPRTAQLMGRVLIDAVEEGTGTRARLANFAVAGKSGTTRATAEGGRYEAGAYIASFVGFFPADDPQLLVLVKLDRPDGSYFGGGTAAPVTRATMEAILAARSAPLDHRALVGLTRPAARAPGTSSAERAFTSAPTWIRATSTAPAPPADIPPPRSGQEVTMPEVVGLSPRTAARRIHAAGLVVEWTGKGRVVDTQPVAGTRLGPGDTVRLISEGGFW
jgi:cell division protein FtsI (penicillin-binding protein 3)